MLVIVNSSSCSSSSSSYSVSVVISVREPAGRESSFTFRPNTHAGRDFGIHISSGRFRGDFGIHAGREISGTYRPGDLGIHARREISVYMPGE